jgi:hypothetical protein
MVKIIPYRAIKLIEHCFSRSFHLTKHNSLPVTEWKKKATYQEHTSIHLEPCNVPLKRISNECHPAPKSFPMKSENIKLTLTFGILAARLFNTAST